jgi:hypothetical protein
MRLLASFLIAIAATLLITLAWQGTVDEPAIEAKDLIESQKSSSCSQGSTRAEDARPAPMERPDPATVIGYLDFKMAKGGGAVSCVFTTANAPACRGSVDPDAGTPVLGD